VVQISNNAQQLRQSIPTKHSTSQECQPITRWSDAPVTNQYGPWLTYSHLPELILTHFIIKPNNMFCICGGFHQNHSNTCSAGDQMSRYQTPVVEGIATIKKKTHITWGGKELH
jgi:hypothetical protein